MNRCPKCSFLLEDGLLVCPKCGADVPLKGKNRGTVQQSSDSGEQTVNLFGENPSDEHDDDEQPAGTGTVSAPGVDVGAHNRTVDYAAGELLEDGDELSQTVDAGMTELDEADDFDLDDDFPGVQSDGFGTLDANGLTLPAGVSPPIGDNQVTLNAFGLPDDSQPNEAADDTNATHIFFGSEDAANDAGQLTIDMASEDRATDASRVTVDARENPSTIPKPAPAADAAGNDADGTVVLPGFHSEASGGDKTVVFESTDMGSSTVEATGASGTEGRLKRLWEGVVGSSQNPMHSLQAVGLQASDSIFERVAMRRVADASVSQDVSADYQIVDKLGEGAMGIVFSARQTAVNRIVAIKTAKPNFQANEESRRRFLYEAHITADLDHSNIVPIHELGASEEGMLFYSMKLVQGTEWSRVMRKKTREQNIEIFMKVTDAMAFAHSKGVIHRDLKPENTMLGRFGEVFVTDWGTAINLDKDTTYLAKPAAKGDKYLTVEDSSHLVRGDSIVLHDGIESYDRVQIASMDEVDRNRLYLRKKLTRDYQPSRRLLVVKSMNLAGTPCYMAPEMAGHQLPKIGKTSDIYILGAILYDLVTGRPPHTGDSVTHCLRAALKNDVIIVENEDPLLKIAYKAMSTDPGLRYQSVEELQEAVREYRRHAESIALTERSELMLSEAIAKNDYDTFSRTLFGYRDAIELWPENTVALNGLKKARLAYGQAAFSQGNFDLALQTLDRDIPEELALAERASAAKKKVEGREASFRLLQKVVAAIVLLAITGLSALAWIANNQKNLAMAAKGVAETQTELANKQTALAEKQTELANEQTAIATEKTALATEAAEKEKLAREQESAAKVEAVLQRQNAEDSKEDALRQKAVAEIEELKAKQAAELAQRRSAQIQLGEYNASLALAKSQIESFDLAAGSDNLQRLRDMFRVDQTSPSSRLNNVFFGNTPKIDSWGWQRIELLGNFDLPKARIAASADANAADGAGPTDALSDVQVSVSACAPQVNLAVVGTKQGLVQLLQFEAGQLRATRQIVESGSVIEALAISPDGQEVVYSATRGDESFVKRWDVSQDETQAVAATQKRPFQFFAYSNDGKQLVAGISGGVWLWDRDANWFSQAEPKFRVSIRGELTNLQAIDSQHTLLTTRFQNEQTLIGVLDHTSQAIELVEVNQPLPAQIRSAAHTLVNDRVVLGLDNNQLLVGRLAPGASQITDLVELADRHRAPVTHIVSDGVGQLITSSESEPVAHVWRYTAESSTWEYDTYLTGTPKNIVGVGLLGEQQVLAVDVGGTSIVWNVERQKQRRRLQRSQGDQPEEYVAPVQAVFAGPSGGRALAIDANGVIDLWSLADGQSQRLDGSRWSYFGHTPGAELVNSAIDVEQAVVVTAASLKQARKEYLSDPTHAWEFCSWDADSGAMLRRWSAPNRELSNSHTESIEQRISLVDNGRQILFASDSETRLVDLNSGQETFQRSDFGSYFAVPNPANTAQLMLVKRSGAVRLLDVNHADDWDDPSLRNFSLADPSDIPLQGAWSEDGQRFYLSFSTGGLAVFQLTTQGLELTWSTRMSEGGSAAAELQRAILVESGRIQSQLDVELAVTGSTGDERLNIVTRRRGLEGTTKLVSLRFTDKSLQPALLHEVHETGVRWLQLDGAESPSLVARIHDSLMIDDSRIRSRLKVNHQTFVSTTAAQVLALTDGAPAVTSYGRTRLIAATGNRQGSALWSLLEDGSIWKFSVEAESGSWSRLNFSALGASSISLSPDGQQMLIVNQDMGSLIDPETGRALAEVGHVRGAAWDPGSPARLAVCRADGTLEIVSQGQPSRLPERPLMAEDAKLVQLSFFNETWEDPAQPVRQFLLVHSEQGQQGALQFVAIDPAPPLAANNPPAIEEIPLDSRVAVSPTENILVTGAPGGTVAVWFAAPTHDPKPRQLFDLEGHRGESLTCITFSSDGRTVITGDTNNRLFAWLSRDPLVER